MGHVGIAVDGQPYVIPVLYARAGNQIYLHGSPLSRLVSNLADGVPMCLTVTLLDGLVLARSAFHHSMNYRSVVLLGEGHPLRDRDEKREALRVLVDRLVPGRSDEARGPSEQGAQGDRGRRPPDRRGLGQDPHRPARRRRRATTHCRCGPASRCPWLCVPARRCPMPAVRWGRITWRPGRRRGHRAGRRLTGRNSVPSGTAATLKGPVRMPKFELDSAYSPTADQPAAIESLAEGDRGRRASLTLLGATGTGKTMTMAGDDRGGAEAGAGDRPQQDAGGPVVQRVPDVLPAQLGRVLRLVLRLLPARGVRPEQGPVHREGLGDQPGDRPAAALGHGGAVRPP